MEQPRRNLSPVVAVGLGLVFLHVCFRAWTLFPSWFYTDDFKFMHDARVPLTWTYLVDPFDQQFMPLGRLLAWVVTDAGPMSWTVAAALTLAQVALAALACLWMLVVLFGVRWSVLVPLALYLSSAIALPASMWWAAALNQVVWQIVFFVAVGCWVHYVRTRRARWLTATLLVLAVGFASYVKTLLILPVLVLLLLGWFLEGRLLDRLRALVRDWWRPVSLLLVAGVGYALFYRAWVPQPFDEPAGAGELLELAWTMLGESLVTGLVGGPWAWGTATAPVATAAPPTALVVLAWGVLTAFLLHQSSRRTGVGRAVGLLVGYALLDLALLAGTRAAIIGPASGTELRYVTDALAVAVLVLALVTSPLAGAPGSSEPRPDPGGLGRIPPWGPPALVGVVVLGGLVSSVAYARVWHTDNPGADYFRTAEKKVTRLGKLPMADQIVPRSAYPGFAPTNTTSYLLPLLSERFSFPDASDLLVVLDDGGEPRAALIEPGVVGADGQPGGCSWPVVDGTVTIPLSATTFDWGWWARIGYLSSQDTPVTVTAGATSVETELQEGLNPLFVHVPGTYDEIVLSGLDRDAKICVGDVTIGKPVPGGEL